MQMSDVKSIIILINTLRAYPKTININSKI